MDPSKNGRQETAHKIQELEQRNRELLARVMRLQGEKDQVTDTDIDERMCKLQLAIRTWVQNVLRDLRHKRHNVQGAFRESFRLQHIRIRLVNLLLRKDALQDDITDWNASQEEWVWARWLSEHVACVPVVLSLVVWRELEVHIFASLAFPLGVESTAQKVFRDIMTTMENSRDGEVAANKWRSETMTALTRGPNFQADIEREVQNVLENLSDALKEWPLMSEANEIIEDLPQLRTTVVQFAIGLQMDMACSSSQYEMKIPAYTRGEAPKDVEFSRWNLKDITQGTTLSPEDKVLGIFHCTQPGFYRLATGDGDPVQVVKPIMLAYDDPGPFEPPSRRGSFSSYSSSDSPTSTRSSEEIVVFQPPRLTHRLANKFLPNGRKVQLLSRKTEGVPLRAHRA
ncbi:hypothetical protein GQ53DRAFT_855903 [Thozetella sp. PMI_491]|nr:hypothetical protein GQ53DRAFT_855903 [Thozetella sp. PMI_491]